jgi:hypothetical protein
MAAILTATPSHPDGLNAFDFGSWAVADGPTASQSFDLENTGDAAGSFSAFDKTGSDPGEFQVVSDTGEASLNPGEVRTFSVVFDPTTGGAKAAFFDLEFPADEFVEIHVEGVGTQPVESLTPALTNFGERQVSQGATPSQLITVENVGNGSLASPAATLAGSDPADFQIVSGATIPPLAAGETHDIEVVFNPASPGAKSAELVVVGSVDLAGVGLGKTAGLTGGPGSWDLKILGGGASPFKIDGWQMGALTVFSGVRSGAANTSATLGGGVLAQVGLVSPTAPEGVRGETFTVTIPADHVRDLKAMLDAVTAGVVRLTMFWPIIDRWALPGEAGQRTAFAISRHFPAIDLEPFEWRDVDNLAPVFVPDDGSGEVQLEVIATGSPTSSQVLIADSCTSLDDEASYRVDTGDLSALGPGYLKLLYQPVRSVAIESLSRSNPARGALDLSFSITETLPPQTTRILS